MSLLMLCLVALGLSIDAFGVVVNRGKQLESDRNRSAVLCGICFGGFQIAAMLLGGLAGVGLRRFISRHSGFAVLAVVLLLIALNGLREGFLESKREAEAEQKAKHPVVLALFTSVDALLVGIGMALLKSGVWTPSFKTFNMWFGSIFVGITTCLIAALGVLLGAGGKSRLRKPLILAASILLLLTDLWFFLEHYGVLPGIL